MFFISVSSDPKTLPRSGRPWVTVVLRCSWGQEGTRGCTGSIHGHCCGGSCVFFVWDSCVCWSDTSTWSRLCLAAGLCPRVAQQQHVLGLRASSGSSQNSLCSRESLAKARYKAQGSLQDVSVSDISHSASFKALALRFISRLPVSSVQKCKMECAWPCTDAGICTDSSKEGQSDSG